MVARWRESPNKGIRAVEDAKVPHMGIRVCPAST